MIRDDIPERRGGVDDATLVNSRDDLLTRCGAKEMLALRQNGDFERRQSPMIGPGRPALGFLTNMLRSILEGLEASNKDVC